MRFTPMVLAIAVSGVAALSVAQTKPAFEVASVKPNKSGSLYSTSNGFAACRYVANNATLKMMVDFAYRLPTGQDLPVDRIIGGPKWMDTEHFDVEAKRGSALDSIEMNRFLLMVQSLLEERFQLRTHWSKQDFLVYNLVVGKEGSKLHRSENQPQMPIVPNPILHCSGTPVGPPPPPTTGPRGTTPPRPQIRYGASGISIDTTNLLVSQLIGIVQPYMDRPIINKTGLTGSYEVKMRFSPERVGGAPVASTATNAPASAGQAGPPDAADPSGISGPSIFTAIQELGLKLEPAKSPLDVLVIDSVSRPSEN